MTQLGTPFRLGRQRKLYRSAGEHGKARDFCNPLKADTKFNSGPLSRAFALFLGCVVAALCLIPTTGGAQMFVSHFGNGLDTGRISEYDATTGALINPTLISDLAGPDDIAVSGHTLFVADSTLGTVGEYTTSGRPVNPRLITLGNLPSRIEISGQYLFVSEPERDRIAKYTTSGKRVDVDLIPGGRFGGGLYSPAGLAVSGDKLFVVNTGFGTIGEYTTSGATINATLISGLVDPSGAIGFDIAISGDRLFVTIGNVVREYTTSGTPVNPALISVDGIVYDMALSGGSLFLLHDSLTETVIDEYTTSGALVNAPLISELVDAPRSLLVVPGSAAVPDASSTWTLLLLGLTAMVSVKHSMRA